MKVSTLLVSVLPLLAASRNILHIQIDDLRTEVGPYVSTHVIHTPNLDALAEKAVVFDRAYAQQALCNPSRASYMTGRRPDTTEIWNLNDNWRTAHQTWTSLPGMFLEAGMKALGCGKTYHDTVQNGLWDALFEYDGFRSWSPESLPYRNPGWTQGVNYAGCPHPHTDIGRWGGNVTVQWCVKKEGDMTDVVTVNHAIELLNNAAAAAAAAASAAAAAAKNGTAGENASFYLAVGFHKPHLPWIAKQEHYDLYPLSEISVANQKTLEGTEIPEIAFQDCDSPTPYEPLTDDDARIARRAYYAAVTGMDEQLGRLLKALEDSGVAKDTAIVLHGDHGWQLGERGMWSKNTNWEPAVRVPLMIAVPWLPESAGTRNDELAELVDLMPTMAELVGIDVPGKKFGDREAPIEGISLVPSLMGTKEKVKVAAFSQYPRSPRNMTEPWAHNSVDHKEAEDFLYMGYSVRVDEWRYTEWYPFDGATKKAKFDEGVYARELYDYRGVVSQFIDYDKVENENVAEREENVAVVSELSAVLMKQFNK